VGEATGQPLVLDSRGGLSTEQAVFDAAARADVVVVGEQHDDPGAHRFEFALLQALAERGRPVTLAMEMFERDVQPALDAYLAGRIDEAQMLERARPWPNYQADYRPLVELARTQGWPVVASNAPRRTAAQIARQGLAALDALAPARRAEVAAELQCGAGPYREKFVAALQGMGGHAGSGGPTDLGRMFDAQCAKDETMAETLAARMAPGAVVVHVNGAFHSDERLGLVERLQRRRPEAKILVVSVVKGDGAPGSVSGPPGDFVVRTP